MTDRFRAVARRFPDHLAVSDGIRDLTYSQLATDVENLATRTAGTVAERSAPVAVLLANEARFAAAVLGVLAAGRGCVPIDADHPLERVKTIATHASAGAVISAGALAARARDIFPNLPIIDIDRHDGARAAPTRAGPDDLAYILYTSGSTGTPKGVYQNHRGLLHDIMQCTNTQHISSNDRVAQFYSPTVISGFRNMLSALLNGATLHILPPRDLNAGGLVREIRRRRITIFRGVPTLFRHVVEALAEGERMDSVRLVVLGGDRVDWRDVSSFKRACPASAHFAVHLGATECSTVYLQWYVDQSKRRSTVLPVGHPVAERSVALLDDNGDPVPEGEVGEFVVSSRYLALGYWRSPEATARAFSLNPADTQVRVFRTGDLGRRRPDGLFEHMGRKDDQVKLRGHRIEPSEIESVLRDCDGVKDAAVVVRRTESKLPRSLVAYIEARPDAVGLSPKALISATAKRLPAYMVPPTIVPIDRLPRLADLKVDRVRLNSIEADRPLAPPVANDPVTIEVIGIFERIIGVTGAMVEDSLATLGGDSLHGIHIALEIEDRFGEVPIDVFESNPTILELSQWITAQKDRAATDRKSSLRTSNAQLKSAPL